METKTKVLDEKDKESLNKAIANSNEAVRIYNWDLKTKKAMLEEGLDINYLATKRKLSEEVEKLEAQIAFEEKVVKQYQEVLEKGEMQVPVEDEKEE